HENKIVAASANISIEVLRHEIMHVLQNEQGGTPTEALSNKSSEAEKQAERAASSDEVAANETPAQPEAVAARFGEGDDMFALQKYLGKDTRSALKTCIATAEDKKGLATDLVLDNKQRT